MYGRKLGIFLVRVLIRFDSKIGLKLFKQELEAILKKQDAQESLMSGISERKQSRISGGRGRGEDGYLIDPRNVPSVRGAPKGKLQEDWLRRRIGFLENYV